MKTKIIDTIHEIAVMKMEWNAFLEKSIFLSPFLRNEYQVAWWQHQGGGEWKSATLAVIVMRDESDALFGIAPLYVTKNQDGFTSLMLVGGIEISDYLDVIVEEKNVDQFWQTVFDVIQSDDFPVWDKFQIYNMSENSASVAILEDVSIEKKFSLKKEIYQPCPQIKLPNSWENYLTMLDKKFKKNLTRRMRMADNHFIPIIWEFIQENDFEKQLETFFDLMAQDPEKNKFLTPQMKIQMKITIQTAYEEGVMQFSVLKMDEEMLAASMFFDYDNKLWGYNSGLNMEHLALSPGLVLKGKHIQWAIEQGYEIYDFMRGGEGYKYDFGAIDTHVLKIEIEKE